jgi:hypothetical protein
MEIVITFLLSPITIMAIGLIVLVGFIASPYDIQFEDKEEIEI